MLLSANSLQLVWRKNFRSNSYEVEWMNEWIEIGWIGFSDRLKILIGPICHNKWQMVICFENLTKHLRRFSNYVYCQWKLYFSEIHDVKNKNKSINYVILWATMLRITSSYTLLSDKAILCVTFPWTYVPFIICHDNNWTI